MHSDTFEQLLDRAATLCGVGPGFWDIWGEYHETTSDAKRSILPAKGYDADDAASLERSLAARTRHDCDRLLPQSIVTGESDHMEAPLNVPVESLEELVRFLIRAEDGATTEVVLKLKDLPADGSIEMDAGARLRKLASLPVKLPPGYHEVTATVAGETATCRVAITPDRAWTPD